MSSVIFYGSLVHPDELSQEGLMGYPQLSIRVSGFRRQFTQEPSWRPGGGVYRAVLNVVEARDCRINAILVAGLPRDKLKDIDRRERGYLRVSVDQRKIECYVASDRARVAGENYIYVGKAEKQSSDIFPNLRYLEICLQGARRRGEEFAEEFVETTFVKGRPLGEFLKARRTGR